MAHQIFEQDGMISAKGIVPWHRHPNAIVIPDDYATVARALELLGEKSNDVHVCPNFAIYPAPPRALWDDVVLLGEWMREHAAIMVPTTATSTVQEPDPGNDPFLIYDKLSRDYRAYSARQAFAFVQDLLDDGTLRLETIGTLNQRKIFWLLCELPTDIRIKDRESEQHKLYLMFSTSHDGSMAVSAKLTGVRVVCRNTYDAAMFGKGSSFSIRHDENLEGRVAEARDALGIVFESAEGFVADLERLAEETMSGSALDAFLADLLPVPKDAKATKATQILNTRDTVRGMLETERDLADVRGTAYGALQAVTAYVDHRTSTRTENPDLMFRRTVFGEGPVGGLKKRAFELLTA